MDLSGFVRKKTKITIGGKEFTFSELTLGNLCEFRAVLNTRREVYNAKRRKRLIEESKDIGNIDSLELIKYIDKPMTEDEIDAEMETTDGIALLAYYSLRPSHEKVSIDDAKKILLPNILEKVTAAMFPPVEETKKKRPRQPVKAS
jgi:hypothetical protein|tara:strand:- start:69 stop:506 length:438 start_codon:yes stop_codon:yes gene_type:complete